MPSPHELLTASNKDADGTFLQPTSRKQDILLQSEQHARAASAVAALGDFGDMMILSMAFPNLLGAYLLCGKVAVALEDCLERLSAKKMPVYK